MKKRKSVLITDLDNTLFDWVEIWYQSFSSMFNKLVEISGIDSNRLKSEIRTIHQKHGTSEYSFLIEEIPSFQTLDTGNRALIEHFSDAIDAHRVQRKKYLRLYQTVEETLLRIKKHGTKIIAYTESMAFYSNYRVRKLGLDGILDAVFSPADHDLPINIDVNGLRRYPQSNYEFIHAKQKHTPKGELKPSPEILTQIIKYAKIDPEDCVYVGDSLFKDIAMAQDAGVDDVWAKYGIAQHREEYDLLRDVTHWTDEDVEYERKVKEREIKPNYTLENQFQEILTHFVFYNKDT